MSPPVALARAANRLLGSGADFRLDLTSLVGAGGFLVFLITLTLPQWSAFSALFQDTLLGWTNLTLAAPEGSPKIGDPVAGGNLIAFVVVAALGAASVYFGYLWNWSVWWRCAAIFYPTWALLYTTFFTNYGGIKSGIWQALGYWVVQQGEGRGGQPWYYYFVITSIYEFLPILIGAIAAVYYLRRRQRDAFDVFLVYWALITLLLFTIASEKMPWLVVGITLPFIALSGKFLADVARRIDWRSSLRMSGYGYMLIPGVPLFLVLLWNLVVYRSSGNVGLDVAIQGDRGGAGGAHRAVGLCVALGGAIRRARRFADRAGGGSRGAVAAGGRHRVLPKRRYAGGDAGLYVAGRRGSDELDRSRRAYGDARRLVAVGVVLPLPDRDAEPGRYCWYILRRRDAFGHVQRGGADTASLVVRSVYRNDAVETGARCWTDRRGAAPPRTG